MDIPSSAFIPCPKVRFAQVRVAPNCPSCEHCRGLHEIEKRAGAAFEETMRVLCAHPIARRMTRIEGV